LQADSVNESLRGYLRDLDVFKRPGTQDNAFRYLEASATPESGTGNPSETIIGELDAGYDWKVILYEDGHVVSRPKQ